MLLSPVCEWRNRSLGKVKALLRSGWGGGFQVWLRLSRGELWHFTDHGALARASAPLILIILLGWTQPRWRTFSFINMPRLKEAVCFWDHTETMWLNRKPGRALKVPSVFLLATEMYGAGSPRTRAVEERVQQKWLFTVLECFENGFQGKGVVSTLGSCSDLSFSPEGPNWEVRRTQSKPRDA